MYSLTRIYLNAAGEQLQVDTIIMTPQVHGIVLNRSSKGITYRRDLTELYLTSEADRVVAKIELIGNFTSFENSSGDFLNCSWVSPGTGDTLAICDMNDLPQVGDTV